MRVIRPCYVCILLLLGFLSWKTLRPPESSFTVRAARRLTPGDGPARFAASTPLASQTAPTIGERDALVERLAYARGWDGELPPELEAFRAWARRYQRASPDAQPALEAEGVALAIARRAVMRELIIADPRRAIALTVPVAVRRDLPAAVAAELETRIAGRGDYALQAGSPWPGSDQPAPVPRRVAFIDGVTYAVHTYGRRALQLSREGASLHGIALDGHLALHESPLRVQGPDEEHATAAGTLCPVSHLAASPGLIVAEAFGRTWEFCATSEDMLERFERQLVEDESGSDPRVPWPGSRPPTAAVALASHTLGPQRVLVLRVDFSDLPGAFISAADAQSAMDSKVKPFFESASYGQTTLTTTVSSNVYRLPQTAQSYASANNIAGMMTDARAMAGTDFDLASFDRVIMVFKDISKLDGSRFSYAGWGDIGGRNVWCNGAFGLWPLGHELGHTYGLMHANLWQVSDGNPVSSSGSSVEYGDPFDVMSSAITDPRYDFNMWEKNRVGWLPNSAVRSVTTSGTYRVCRFDHRDAATFNQPLALKIFRDGMRSYWIGLRQNFASNFSLSNGAYVLWGSDTLQATQLLNLGAPGSAAENAALMVGRSFTDPVYGITIRPVAVGGTDPGRYLDVEITLSARPSDLAQWGSSSALPSDLMGVRSVASSSSHTLALKNDGTVIAWIGAVRLDVPSDVKNVIAITVASDVSAVLKDDGSVQLWSRTTNPVTTPPAGLGRVRQFALGGFNAVHAVALRDDGTVVAWGNNTAGQANVPAGLRDVVAIGAGADFSVALKADGTVLRWGARYIPEIPFPATSSGVIGIATSSMSSHVLGLKGDGTVVAWGANSRGQCNVPAGLGNVVALASGGLHSLALKADGTIVAWGDNSSGQADVPVALPRVFGLAANAGSSFALVGSDPFITAQPRSQVVVPGMPVTLNVAVSPLDTASYQWRKNSTPIAGATGAALTLDNPGLADGGFYDVVITSNGSRTISTPARISVVTPIVIALQPRSQIVEIGAQATFSVTASGGGAISYQWRKNGTAIPGAVAGVFTLYNAALADGGRYDVTLTDGASAIASTVADLTVVPAGHLANLSIRTRAGTGAQALIVGFVVGGAGTGDLKPLLLRGVGPTLRSFGVTGVLADPRLDLFNVARTNIAQNDNWSGDPQIASVGAQVGAFAFADVGSRDAALFQPGLSAGSYTVQISGVDGTSGVALAEIYDASVAETFSATMRRLTNISARANVGTGGDVLIAGFNIAGSIPRSVIIRAIGPTLGSFGLSDVLTDPRLDLYNGSATKIRENDNWGGDPALVRAFTSVGAFPLGSATRDAALLATLSPGSYTAQISGVGGTSGLALIEIYEVP